jgi:hypothetical protein
MCLYSLIIDHLQEQGKTDALSEMKNLVSSSSVGTPRRSGLGGSKQDKSANLALNLSWRYLIQLSPVDLTPR